MGLRKFFAILIIIAGIAGLVLPVVPGVALIIIGLSLFFKGKNGEDDKDNIDIP